MSQLFMFQAPNQGEYITTTDWGQALPYLGFWKSPSQGYLLPHGEPDLAKLRLYAAHDRSEHLTAATAEGAEDAGRAGYSDLGAIGLVSRVPKPGLIALKLYRHPQSRDHATVAAAENENSLINQGYQFVRVEGYVSSRPLQVKAHLSSSPGGGFSIETSATLTPAGAMSATTKVTNHNWFWGFRAGFFLVYSDGVGTILGVSAPPQRWYGAWATAMGAPVQHTIPWTDTLEPRVAADVVSMMIVQYGADSPDSVVDQFIGYAHKAVEAAAPVVELASKLIALKAAVSTATA